jgi:CYTH domain-containing protein
MANERERKFLVNRLPKELMGTPSRIIQGYIPTVDKSIAVRIRTRDEAGFITFKRKLTDITNAGYETDKDRDIAKEMIKVICHPDNIIDKFRYVFPVEGTNLSWELDVFNGANDTLVLVEVEMPEETSAFELPDWIGTEVTSDKRYSNANLAVTLLS